MNYEVYWDSEAIEALQRIAVSTNDPEGLAHTVLRLGLELGMNPLDAGESRERGRRVLFKYPLVVRYYVNERTNEVTVYYVRLMRRG